MWSYLLLCVSVVVVVVGLADGTKYPSPRSSTGITRSKFPKGFLLGAASSAYQVEGAINEDGKLNSTWDTFAHIPGKIADNSTGDVGVDHYHRYKEDIQLVKEMGMDVYRFSIAWTRIYPKGAPRNGPVNKAGIKHYNDVINDLLKNGITPMVTLFHWDTPQYLEDEYGGWRSRRIIEDYKSYVDVCFKEFGDRVKLWATINEPYISSLFGIDISIKCALPNANCKPENSSTKPYVVAHNILLAHSAGVKLYRLKYQKVQNGQIGIVVNVPWTLPFNRHDVEVWKRVTEFRIGWFMEPLTIGKYPDSMRKLVAERLPEFTAQESMELRGSLDFVGINYYDTQWVINNPNPGFPRDFFLDAHANVSTQFHGILIGKEEGSSIFRSHAPGLRQTLNYFKLQYNNPIIYITETGYANDDNGTMPLEQALNDTGRVKYHEEHLAQALLAINKDGVNLKGYIAWSLLDSFEWGGGLVPRFGLVYVDYKRNLQRHFKASAKWFKDVLHR